AQYPQFQPQLVVVQAGERPDSTTYIRMKAKAAEEVSIKFNHVTFPETATAEEIIQVVKKLSDDDAVGGVLVQLPLGPNVNADDTRAVTEAVSPEKDVDGFHAYNIGHLSLRAASPLFIPCTPAAVIRLLENTGISIAGANAVVLGRSDIVGNPVAALLRSRDATVTQCHSRTK
ncbi:tetrahydrofolate dehydrogenase/cyclohydrolase, partial [Suillus clintonianus]|uniref:tetrahydrofolate dehydrogenase/cyclohydrolase n=1 Tax=Suillus clintonianus TaxID=1904413 RepID=UPI001B8600F6